MAETTKVTMLPVSNEVLDEALANVRAALKHFDRMMTVFPEVMATQSTCSAVQDLEMVVCMLKAVQENRLCDRCGYEHGMNPGCICGGY